MQSDEELLRGFASGRRDALGQLAERYEQPLLSLSCAILGSKELAVDAVQETWVRVIRHATGFNGRSQVKTWLYRIAINQCRSLLSARPSDLDSHEEGLVGMAPESPASANEHGVAKQDNPVETAIRKDEAERLKKAVEALSTPLREAILVCYTHGLTHEEASEVLHVPVGTVKSRVHAALEQLRQRLKSTEC